ncbi:MAG: DUF6265 family protein [Parvularculaceae bacterium]
MSLITTLALAIAASVAVDIRSAPEGADPPSAKIEDVAFLTGHWIGEGLGACAEEIMSAPSGGQIMGMFRSVAKDGSLRFYEFYTIAEKDGSLVLKIKHFNPDLTGWEEKNETVDFPLVEIEGETAYFDDLTFARTGKKSFASAVMVDGQGAARFSMRAAKPDDACKAAAP